MTAMPPQAYKKTEIAQFCKDYGEAIRDAATVLMERDFIDVNANEKKTHSAGQLKRIIDTLQAIEARNGATTSSEKIILEGAPQAMRQARDILHQWFKPYFHVRNNRQLTLEDARAEIAARHGTDWTPAPGQEPDAIGWYNLAERLHEASEVFAGRVMGQKVFSTIPGSM